MALSYTTVVAGGVSTGVNTVKQVVCYVAAGHHQAERALLSFFLAAVPIISSTYFWGHSELYLSLNSHARTTTVQETASVCPALAISQLPASESWLGNFKSSGVSDAA